MGVGAGFYLELFVVGIDYGLVVRILGMRLHIYGSFLALLYELTELALELLGVLSELGHRLE